MTEEVQADMEIEAIFNRQDEALALLERLRLAEPSHSRRQSGVGGGRRDTRRWPMPEGITLELHDSVRWQLVKCVDMGVGGARIQDLPEFANGPTPVRLKSLGHHSVLALSDVMWNDSHAGISGIRFEFIDADDRELWAGLLIDALLAGYSLG